MALGLGLGIPYFGSKGGVADAADGGALAAALLGSETNGLALVADDMSLGTRDTTTPANVFLGDANSKLTYTSPHTKYILNSSGIYEAGTTLRCEYDASGNPLGIRIEEQRTNVVLHNRDARITHQLSVTGGAGSFVDGETVTASGGGTGVYVSSASTASLFALRGGSGTFSGTLTGSTSGATKTISSSATVWVHTNVTPAKDQTGIDGVANSASSLTATAGNATCLQAITLASSARYQSAFIKRISGSGAIQMTMDNGTTWTAVTVTSSWAPVEIPTQTLANPTVGFRIVTSGDAIAVDVVGNENGTSRTSPIVTAGSTVTRAADSGITLATSLFPWSASNGILAIEFTPLTSSGNGGIAVSDGTSANRIGIFTGATSHLYVVSGGVDQANIDAGSVTVGSANRIAASFSANDFAATINGGSVVKDASGSIPAVTSLRFGQNGVNGTLLNGHIRRVLYLPRNRASDAELQGFLA